MKPSAPTTQTAKRVGAIMHRRDTTRWSPREIRVFQSLMPIEESDLASMERYYRMNWPPRHGKNALRTDLHTLIYNWPGELDRANLWNELHPEKPKPRKIIPLPLTGEKPYVAPTDPETLEQIAKFNEDLLRRKQARKT